MSLLLRRLTSSKLACRLCLVAFPQRSYGTAAHVHTVAHLEGTDLPASSTPPTTPVDTKVNAERRDPLVEGKSTPSNTLGNSKIQAYLNEVKNASVTVQDLEHFKPTCYGTPGTSQYEHDYNTVLNNILRSFSAKQLHYFANLYSLSVGKRATKMKCAVAVMEGGWKMPSLIEIRREQKDSTEDAQEDFILESYQCFLLLGKDGVNLLQLSSKYNVQISLSSKPLCIQVKGVRTALKKLAAYISRFKEDIGFHLFDVENATSISAELLNNISRKCGAFIEHSDDGHFRIIYRKSHPSTLSAAKRLLTMTVAERMERPSLLSYKLTKPDALGVGNSETLYSMYPFNPPYTYPRSSGTAGLFRVRDVKVAAAVQAETSGLLARSHGVTESIPQRLCDVRDQLLQGLNTDPNSTKIITATPGHLLWTSQKNKTHLTPALVGALPFEKFAEWMRNHRASSIFSPSSPIQVLNTPAKKQRILRRLKYTSSLSPGSSVKPHTMVFEITLASKSYLSSGIATAKDIPLTGNDILESCCRIESGSTVDVLLPDCPMDIRFSLTNSLSLSRQKWPEHLDMYYNELGMFLSANQEASQPAIPLKFNYNDVEFILQSTASVRQNFKSAPVDTDAKFDVVTESISNTEDNDTSVLCQVECNNFSDVSWLDFLRCCDLLTHWSHLWSYGSLYNGRNPREAAALHQTS